MILSVTFDVHFDIFVFIAFFTGFFFGAVFLVLFYLLISLISLRKSSKLYKDLGSKEKEAEIKELIKIKQKDFMTLKKSESTFDALRISIIDMINKIAASFYPNSKHPIAELTLDELLLLDKYIVEKIESILNRRGLKLFKKIKVSTILKIADASEKIQNNKAIKWSKKMHVPTITKVASMTINAINPFYWFKKLVVSPSMNYLIKKILLLTIWTIGAETYNVYSKKIFIDDDMELIEINKSLEEDQSIMQPITKEEVNS